MMDGDSVGESFHEHRVLVWDGIQLQDVTGSAGLPRLISILATQTALLNVAEQSCYMLRSDTAALVTATHSS